MGTAWCVFHRGSAVDFAVLGPVEARRAGAVLPVGSGRERSVLAMLLLNADRMVAADRLVDALWEDPPASARAQLHNMISNLRRRLDAEGLIVTRPLGYEMRLGSHQLDLRRFRRLVERGHELAAAGDHRHAAAVLSEAAALWRGPALADVPDALVCGVREELHEERLAAAEAHLDAELALRRYDIVVQTLAGLMSDHPYRERLYEIQMVALVSAGRQVDALEAYQRVYRRFVEDLGVEPGHALRQLEQRILRGEMLGPDRPPARVVPRELPPVAPMLTGRDKLTGAVSDALRRLGDGGPAVAVLVGPGGVGKTAVAIACAHGLAEAFPDGQLFADLRGSYEQPAEPHAVVGRFLRALGVDGANLPDDPDERVAMYRSRLADSRTLVVLDDAASEEQLRPLVSGGAGCAALVTSRRQLGGLVDAVRWSVPVLATGEALELFARIVGQDRIAEPEAAAEIVDACGRLPLAVCIAAARLAARPDWTVDELRRRLAEERSRLDELSVGDLDVRASIGLSYRSLDPLPRQLFRWLGLAGFPDWPDWVADTLLDRPAGRLLDQLVDAHLIEPVGRDALGQSRFRLHDLIADFARERALAEDPPQHRTDAQTRLLSAWLALATEADQRIPHELVRAPATDVWPPPAAAARRAAAMPSGWFEAERHCLVLAVDQACRSGLPDLAGPLALRVAAFLGLRSYNDDWDRTLRQALSCVREHDVDHLLVRLLAALFTACQRRDRYAELPAIAAEELALARRLADREAEVRALSHAGIAAARLCRFDEALEWLEHAVTQARHPNVADWLLRDALAYFAFTSMISGRPARSLPAIEEALDLDRQSSNAPRTARHLYHYGMALTDLGRLADAEAPLTEALRTCRELGDDLHAAYVEQALADVDIRRNRFSTAAERLERARQAHGKIGAGDGLAETLRSSADLAAAQGRWPDAITLLRRALDIWRTIESHIEIARALARLERAHTIAGEPDAADTCRHEYQSILAELNLDDACLYLPPQYRP